MDKEFKKNEMSLFSEIQIETLRGNIIDVDLEDLPPYSNDDIAKKFQGEFQHWCIVFKKYFVSDLPGFVSEDAFDAIYWKQHLLEYANVYANEKNNRFVEEMKPLYFERDIDRIAEQISLLAQFACYRKEKDIYKIPNEILRSSIEPSVVNIPIGLYVFYTILVNPHFTIKQFNWLFTQAWFKYYNDWSLHLSVFRHIGYDLKVKLVNVLIF